MIILTNANTTKKIILHHHHHHHHRQILILADMIVAMKAQAPETMRDTGKETGKINGEVVCMSGRDVMKEKREIEMVKGRGIDLGVENAGDWMIGTERGGMNSMGWTGVGGIIECVERVKGEMKVAREMMRGTRTLCPSIDTK